MKKAVSFFGSLLLTFGILMAIDAFKTSKDGGLVATGIITKFSEGGVNDVVIELKGHENSYYINRGFEHGFTLYELNHAYLGKKATILYSENSLPFDFLKTKSRNLNRLTISDTIVFSEF